MRSSGYSSAPLAAGKGRAKPVVVREHMKRKGKALLGRSAETGDLLDNESRKGEDELIRAARARAMGTLNIKEHYRAKHPKQDGAR